jgi:hypothetical protein
MMYVGIDPGFTGALATHDHATEEWRVIDMPVLHANTGYKTLNGNVKYRTDLDLDRLGHWINELVAHHPDIHVMLERAQPMGASKNGRTQGVSSTGRYMEAYGVLIGLLTALSIPYTTVSAAKWKRDLAVPADKRQALDLTRKLIPDLIPHLTRLKDHGRAEAGLICHYNRMTDVLRY